MGVSKPSVGFAHFIREAQQWGANIIGISCLTLCRLQQEKLPLKLVTLTVLISVLMRHISGFFSCYTGHFWSVCICELCSTVSKKIFLWSSLTAYSKCRLGPDNSDKNRKSFRDGLFFKCCQSPRYCEDGQPQPAQGTIPAAQPTSICMEASPAAGAAEAAQNVQNNAPDGTCCLPMPE